MFSKAKEYIKNVFKGREALVEENLRNIQLLLNIN